MTMDQSAVKEIKESQTTAELAKVIDQAKLSTPAMAAPKDFQILNLEKYQQGRTRYRGKMETTSLEDFEQYCMDFGNESAKCFVDPESMTAQTIFNLGTTQEPGHADFSAKLRLIKTAEFKALLQLNGDRSSQKNMAEFMEDYADNILCYTADGEAINTSKAIAAVRRLTIESSRKEDHSVEDFKSSRSALENIEARSDEGLPAGFKFECVPYNGLESRSFDLRLSILTGGDAPRLTARIKRLEAIQEAMGRELQQSLSSVLVQSQMKTYIGDFAA
ncbi:DUF2303 family protein [Microbulbifer sp. THAF38]|uniref:DUF2303 family protein n=1 Tax=Microbulbifer sp. THAF38 TaxID=2587856 RepID=UPI0012A85F17|nr:DUF2303 family protein [Microbulbifer sp. THAF38]QFT53514.1 hypothetical protein FIU95_02875 [Microbulbifer sp. THAF38]